MIDKEKAARLGDLWNEEKGELILRVHHALTEPTCPTATIEWEDGEIITRMDRDTISEAIDAAIDQAILALIEKEEPRDG